MKLARLNPILIATVCICGCGQPPAGDVDTAQKAAAAAPKSVEQLPNQMPPEAQRGAEAAMGQARAAEEMAQSDARSRAMREMQNQRR